MVTEGLVSILDQTSPDGKCVMHLRHSCLALRKSVSVVGAFIPTPKPCGYESNTIANPKVGRENKNRSPVITPLERTTSQPEATLTHVSMLPCWKPVCTTQPQQLTELGGLISKQPPGSVRYIQLVSERKFVQRRHVRSQLKAGESDCY
jgi:hypothetical protein